MTESAAQSVPSSNSDSGKLGQPRDRHWVRRLVRGVCVFALIPYVAITILLTLFQRQLIYHRSPSPPLLLADAGFTQDAGRDVSLTTDDGLTLHGWLLNANGVRDGVGTDGAVTVGAPPPLVLYFPGNAMHRLNRLNDLRDFTALGCDVLIFDYRGYGENPGSPSEAVLTRDARDIWQFAVDQLQVEPGRILLFGESLGGAVAVRLAQMLCREGTPPAGLITNATFASMPRLATWHYPLFPLGWLVWDRWPSVECIPHVTCPLLMFHGTNDQIVPCGHGRELFAAAPDCSINGCEKTFVEIAGAGHNDVPVSRLRKNVQELLLELGAVSPR